MSALALLFSAAACDSEPSLPDDNDLVGLWVNDDGGQIRAFAFMATAPEGATPALAAKPFVYELNFYTRGTAPVVVQRGHYSVQFGRLVTEVVEAPIDPSQAGRKYGNDVLGFSSSRLTLQSDSAPNGQRVYQRVEVLP